jgi:hypothetical protein
VDVAGNGSPSWWLDFLSKKFIERDRTYDLQQETGRLFHPYWRTRRQRLNMLWSYYIGQPPLPQVAHHYHETFRDVLRKARANYAPKAVQPMVDRMDLLGVRTGVTDGIEGDDVAKRIMLHSNFAAAIKDAFIYTFAMSESYMMVIPAAPGAPDQTPLVTAEDPRMCIGEPDPMNPNNLQAALKVGYDPVGGKVIAYLFHDGVKYTAAGPEGQFMFQAIYDASSFEWSADPVPLPQLQSVSSTVPVIQLPNARGMGEFEPYLDVLDRINDTILQRVVISAYQSFKQRAIIGDLEGEGEDDEDAPVEDIDFNELFSADPGALWRVPEKTTFWESGPVDMTGIITAIRDDVKEFAAVTDTPLHLITPDAANQTAEGASTMREGLVFKVKDRRARLSPKLIELFKMAFAFAGESDRTDNIELLWGPVESFSLTEKSNAVAQTKGVLSRSRQLQDIMEMTPDQIQQNEQELHQDAITDMALGAAAAGQVRVTETTSSRTDNSQRNGQAPQPSAPSVP